MRSWKVAYVIGFALLAWALAAIWVLGAFAVLCL